MSEDRTALATAKQQPTGASTARTANDGARDGQGQNRRTKPVLLFDLDGTLTDSLPGISASFVAALESVGRKVDADDDLRWIAGPPLLDTLTDIGLDGKELDTAVDAYRARYNAVGWAENSVFTGIESLLRDLHSRNYRMAVSTSKNEDSAERILRHFGLADYFEVIAGADLSKNRRAKADVIASALERLDIPPQAGDTDRDAEVLMIGDRAHDVEGAARHGIPAVAVQWGYGTQKEWDSARWSVSTVQELEGVIRDW